MKWNPNFSRSRIDLGKLLLKQNRAEEGIKQLEAARELDPNDKAVYSQLAVAYRRKGENSRASAMLAMVNKLNDEERSRESHNLLRIVKEGPDQDGTLEKPRDGAASKKKASGDGVTQPR